MRSLRNMLPLNADAFDRSGRRPVPTKPATLLVGWLLLGEPLTALQAARLVTVLSGFYLAQRQS
jgi:hypothetical protein